MIKAKEKPYDWDNTPYSEEEKKIISYLCFRFQTRQVGMSYNDLASEAFIQYNKIRNRYDYLYDEYVELLQGGDRREGSGQVEWLNLLFRAIKNEFIEKYKKYKKPLSYLESSPAESEGEYKVALTWENISNESAGEMCAGGATLDYNGAVRRIMALLKRSSSREVLEFYLKDRDHKYIKDAIRDGSLNMCQTVIWRARLEIKKALKKIAEEEEGKGLKE